MMYTSQHEDLGSGGRRDFLARTGKGLLGLALLVATPTIGYSAEPVKRTYASPTPPPLTKIEEALHNTILNYHTPLEERLEASVNLGNLNPEALRKTLSGMKKNKKHVEYLVEHGVKESVPHIRHISLYKAREMSEKTTTHMLQKIAEDSGRDSFERGYALEWLGIQQDPTVGRFLFKNLETNLRLPNNEYLAIQNISALNFLGYSVTKSEKCLEQLTRGILETDNAHVALHLLLALQPRIFPRATSRDQSAEERKEKIVVLRKFVESQRLNEGEKGILDIIEANHIELERESAFNHWDDVKGIEKYLNSEPKPLQIESENIQGRETVEKTLALMEETLPLWFDFVKFVPQKIKIAKNFRTMSYHEDVSIYLNNQEFLNKTQALRTRTFGHEGTHLYNQLVIFNGCSQTGYGHETEEMAFEIEARLMAAINGKKITVEELMDHINKRLAKKHWVSFDDSVVQK